MISVNSDAAAGQIGKAILSVSPGGEIDDQVAKLIGSLHIQVAELVRIFAECQRANREFSGHIQTINTNIERTTEAQSAIRIAHATLSNDFLAVRKDVNDMVQMRDRLNTLLSFGQTLTSVSEAFLQASQERLANMENGIRDARIDFQDGLKEILRDVIAHREESVKALNDGLFRVDSNIRRLNVAMEGHYLELNILASRGLWALFMVSMRNLWNFVRGGFC